MPRMEPPPAAGRNSPQSALMMVVLPEPLGPRNPKISPLPTGEAHVVNRGEFAEAKGQVIGCNGRRHRRRTAADMPDLSTPCGLST